MAPVKASHIPFSSHASADDPLAVTQRIFRERGDQRYSLELLPARITFDVDRLRRSSQELWGEVAVTIDPSIMPSARSIDGMLSVGDMNFSSVAARGTRAKYFAERSGMSSLDWVGFLEEFCVKVIAAERRGRPAVVLADIELPDEDESREAWDLDGFPVLKELPMVLFGDSSCIASGTSIDGPDGPRAVEGLARDGDPFRVWALNATGESVPAWADAPTLKGMAPLFRIQVGSESIVVTRRHRFLTPTGWRRAGDLVVGDALAVSSPGVQGTSAGETSPPRLRSTSAAGQSIRAGDVLRSRRIPEGSLSSCSAYSCLCDAPLLLAEEHVPTSPQRPAGVPARNRFGERADGPAGTATRSLFDPRSARLSTHGSIHAERHSLGASEYPRASSRATLHSWSNSAASPSLPSVFRLLPMLESCQLAAAVADARSLPSEPRLDTVVFGSIASISYVGYGAFFDFWVPGYENYSAAGLWNHNSGKSYFATWIAGQLAKMGEVVLYNDWEFSEKEHRKRLQRLFNPMPRGIIYAHCDNAITHEADRIYSLIKDHKITYAINDSIGFAVDGPAESQESARTYFKVIRHLGIGTLNIAHIAKGREEGKDPTIFGSAFFRAGARSCWYVDRASSNPPGELRFGLHHRKNNIGGLLAPRGYKLVFDRTTTRVEPADIKAIDELSVQLPVLDRIKKQLSDGAMSPKALCEELNLPIGSVRSCLSRHKSQFIKVGLKFGLREEGADF